MAADYSLFNTRETPPATPFKTPGVDVTGTGTYYSDPIGPRTAGGFGFHFEWTGNPTGTITMWRSNKKSPNLLTDADWVQVSTFSPTNPAGTASKYGDEVTFTSFKLYRFKYVNASGAGTLFCYASQTAW